MKLSEIKKEISSFDLETAAWALIVEIEINSKTGMSIEEKRKLKRTLFRFILDNGDKLMPDTLKKLKHTANSLEEKDE